MLIVTQGGMLVQFHHIAYVALKTEEQSPSERPATETRHKVLLFLPTGDSLVCARHLTLPAAQFLREDITKAYLLELKIWKASESLKRHEDGAYFSE